MTQGVSERDSLRESRSDTQHLALTFDIEVIKRTKISLTGRGGILVVDALLEIAPKSIRVSGRRSKEHVVYVDHHRDLRFGMYIDVTVSLNRGPTKTLHNVAKFTFP